MKIRGKTYYRIKTRNTFQLTVTLAWLIFGSISLDYKPPAAFFAAIAIILLIRLFYLKRAADNELETITRLKESGRKYEGKYHSTEKTGMRKYRIKVSYTHPFTGEEKYFYSTDILYDPKIFIPDITDVSIYVDQEDEERYFVDFHGSLPANEAVVKI